MCGLKMLSGMKAKKSIIGGWVTGEKKVESGTRVLERSENYFFPVTGPT